MSTISAETIEEIGDGLNRIANSLPQIVHNFQHRIQLLQYAMSLGHLGAMFNYGIMQSSLGNHMDALCMHRNAAVLGYGLIKQQQTKTQLRFNNH